MRRNAIGIFVVLVLFVLSFVVAPDTHLKEAQLLCATPESAAIFPSLDACSMDPKFRSAVGCSCGRVSNPWHKPYQLGLVPLVAGLVGYALFVGTLRTRLFLLNSAIAVGVLAEFMRQVIKDSNALMIIMGLPIIAGMFCLAATAVFLLAHLIHRKLRNHAT